MLTKTYLPILALLITLSACTMPAVQEPTADPAVVEQIVGGTLTAQAPATQESTPTLLPTETATLPTETLPPTATETVDTATPTITVVVSGFRDTLGSPAWRNELNDGQAFGLDNEGYQDDNTRIVIENGAMVLSSSSIYGYRGWRLTSKSPADVYLEAKFDVQSCSGADLYGIVYRAPDYVSGKGYYLGITCEGNFSVTKWTDAGSRSIITSTFDDAILSGSGQTNRLGIQMLDDDFYVHINNKLVTQFSDDSFSDGGHIGVFIAGGGNGNLRVSLDEIAYWNLQ
jgi:hypothetical protein